MYDSLKIRMKNSSIEEFKKKIKHLLLVLFFGLACHESPSVEPNQEALPSDVPNLIILISIDTLRADHLSLYGHSRFTSPRIDVFASEGVSFTDASSVAPWTLPAHASLFTGRNPLEHEVIISSHALPKHVPTLAEILKQAGWDTAAAVNSMWIGNPKFELKRGFGKFLFIPDDVSRRLPNEQITNQAMEWIDKDRDAPLFVFMHYYDVHSDYTSLGRYEKMFVQPYDGKIDGEEMQLQIMSLPDAYIKRCQETFDPKKCVLGESHSLVEINKDMQKPDLDPVDIQHLEELYDAGIRQMDDELGRFFSFLDERGLMETSAVIITSDHGEEFMDHGRLFHHLTTYQESLRIPLIMRGMGLPQGISIETPVSIIDIPPTVLDWADLPPDPGMSGYSLGPLIKEIESVDGVFETRLQYGEASGGIELAEVMGSDAPLYFSVRKNDYKLIFRQGDESPSLYDLSADPNEKNDVSASYPDVTRNLWQALKERRDLSYEKTGGIKRIELDEEERETLRSLGYILP